VSIVGEASFRAILEAAPDGILLADTRGTILFANAMAEEMFGYDRGGLIGTAVDALIPEHLREEHRAHRTAYAAEPRARPMGIGLRLEGQHRDGTTFPAEICLSPGTGEARTLVTAIVRDVTAQHEVQEQRGRLLAELEAQLERERIAGDLHDDIIQSVYSAGLGLRADLADPSVPKETLGERTTEALSAVIADLRAYISQLRAGGATTASDMFRARVESLVEGSGPRPSWSVSIRDEQTLTPELERHLYLILKELVSNVTRHSGAAHASLTVSFGDETVEMEVKDDGIGFERTGIDESSLGLRSIEQRVADVGGSVLVESEAGRGTNVRASLPLRTGPDEDPAVLG
jgi:PAS domain S-box-containing protein